MQLMQCNPNKTMLKGGPKKMYRFKNMFTLYLSRTASYLQNSCVYPHNLIMGGRHKNIMGGRHKNFEDPIP